MTKNEIIVKLLNLIKPDRPLLIMLVGLPACGKSTFSEQFITNVDFTFMSMDKTQDVKVISSDYFFDKISEQTGLTYNELFSYKDIYRIAEKAMYMRIKKYDGHLLIWDQTNLTRKSREQKLKHISEDYIKIAIEFDEPKDLDFRLTNRPGKNIPNNVIESMRKNYEPVVLDEGFSYIFKYEN